MFHRLALAFILQGTPTAPPIPQSARAPEGIPAADTAVLRIGTRVIVTLRSSLGASGPAERVAAAQTRIAHLLEAGMDSISVDSLPEGRLILLGGKRAFLITPADLDTLRSQTLVATVDSASTQFQAAIRDYRETRSLRALTVGLGMSALATLGLWLALRLLRRVRRWAEHQAGRLRQVALSARLRRLAAVFDPRLAIRPLTALVKLLMGLLAATLVYVYASFLLTRFPWTRPWGERLGDLLQQLLVRLGWGVIRALPDLVAVVLILVITRLIARGLQRFFEAVEEGVLVIPGLHSDTANPTRRILTALVWLFAIILMYPYLPGSESEAFRGVSVFAGLLLSLGSAGLVGQAMSGLVLMYARSFRPGDYVRLGTTEGTVQQLGLLSTRIRTPKDEYVTIPNAVVTAGSVTNFSAAARSGHALLVYSSVTIGYDVPRSAVEEALRAAARRTDGVLDQPPPFVLVRALNDWAVEYQVNAPVDPRRASELPRFYSALHSAVYDTFAEAGIEIMSPSYLALRDGNAATLPPDHQPSAPPGGFRVRVEPS